MRILLHLCCGPCAVYPVARLRAQGHEVYGLFFNPNIHPYQEFRRRIQAVRQFADIAALPVEIDTHYGLTDYLRRVVFHEKERCPLCYAMRLEHVAAQAQAGGFDAFTTTLLYSRYQRHDEIVRQCEALAKAHEIGFYYEDFRVGWQEGIDESIRLELYRQPYCGCVYSEQERYDKQLRKKRSSRHPQPGPEPGAG
ncbi:MAG: epoxyqueuosine reductase QueH [Desulfobulbus sp.]|jgi:predicted adenine nucleotide alpha hydrolase (AANH) superfamily ATPase